MKRLVLSLLVAALPIVASADELGVRFVEPTDIYGHGVLGSLRDHTGLEFRDASGAIHRYDLPEGYVFEDTAPRLVDLDGDANPEIIAVRSKFDTGAAIVVFDVDPVSGIRVRAQTPEIGTRFRWRAISEFGDFDGDGRIEIAEVETPHLAKVLRFWRLEDDELIPIAEVAGITTTHRIGDEAIFAIMHKCPNSEQAVLQAPSADFEDMVFAWLDDGKVETLPANAVNANVFSVCDQIALH